jgi:hypothetical protein
LSSGWTSDPTSGLSSVSGSKRRPAAGSRSDTEIPDSVIVALAATSRSSSEAGAAAGAEAASHPSGSNPLRSVKRQCSSFVVGSGSAL